ncbi:MAG: 50S ribosomal protein L24 [Patescibacteria group bacterium]|jgi:large subunit ribosomal protein L24
MKIKKGDKVEIITGKDKGKSGKIMQVFSNENKVVVEGLNLLVKNTRPRRQGEKGQQVRFPAPINLSNVMLVCPKCGKKTRVGFRLAEKKENNKSAVALRGKKFRECKKCKQVIE